MALTAEQMAAMSALLDQALELDAADRQRWLQALDPKYRELEPALRQALLGDGPGMETSPRLGAPPPASGAQPGVLIGPYRLLRPLGEGGMAEVWLAQRADGAYQREVALKLPATLRRRDLASRFARERDILARLEHPNIARLYDAGVSESGQPYLAMEYVSGQPLIAWCDTHRMGVRERLRLFLQVLDAVQYAHEQGVIHRDLKPSNILVTEAGQVRLLDFGVAKLLAPERHATELTQLYGQALTPQYASPEQLRGDEVGAASDVYSLGVLLYELLAGALPYKIKAGASAGLLEQAVVTAAVQRPSTRIDDEAAKARTLSRSQLARRLQGDLDAIVLKALAKEPAQRYDSTTGLAEDLRRHLAGEPVLARPDTPVYRVSKFVGRHPAGVAANAVATVLVIVATVHEIRHRPAPSPAPAAVTSATRVSAAAPAPAASADDKSIAVLPFVDMSEKHDQEYFSDGLSEELIDRLSHSPDLKVTARTSSFYFKGKQVTIGEIAKTLGVAHLLEGSVRKSGNELRITAQLIRAADGSHLWSQTYDRKLTDIFKLQGEIAGTVAQALQVSLRVEGPGSGSRSTNTEAYNLFLQANFFYAHYNQADTERAIALYQQAISLDPKLALAWTKLSSAYMYETENGWVRVAEGNARARNAVERALAIDPNLADAHMVRGFAYQWIDWNWKAALAEYERAQELDPGSARLAAARAHVMALVSGQYDKAITANRQALLRDPVDVGAHVEAAYNFYYAGRPEESAAMWRKVLLMNPSLASAHAKLATALLLADKRAEALAAVEEESDESSRLSISPIVYWSLGRKAESDTALRSLETKFAATMAYNIAMTHAYRGESDPAIQWLDRAYRQRDDSMVTVKVEPLLRNLRSDSRYQVILVKMNLAD